MLLENSVHRGTGSCDQGHNDGSTSKTSLSALKRVSAQGGLSFIFTP